MARRSETRAEERARGYLRPAARLGITEHAYRTRGARTTEERQQLGGHRSTADLERTLRRPDVTSADVTPGTRDAKGRYEYVDVVVTYRDGTERTYRLQGAKATSKELQRLADRLGRAGVGVSGIDYLAGRAKGKAA